MCHQSDLERFSIVHVALNEEQNRGFNFGGVAHALDLMVPEAIRKSWSLCIH